MSRRSSSSILPRLVGLAAATATLGTVLLVAGVNPAAAGGSSSFFSDINHSRSQHGLRPLSMSSSLNSVASSWSQHMAAGGCGGGQSICHNPNLTGQSSDRHRRERTANTLCQGPAAAPARTQASVVRRAAARSRRPVDARRRRPARRHRLRYRRPARPTGRNRQAPRAAARAAAGRRRAEGADIATRLHRPGERDDRARARPPCPGRQRESDRRSARAARRRRGRRRRAPPILRAQGGRGRRARRDRARGLPDPTRLVDEGLLPRHRLRRRRRSGDPARPRHRQPRRAVADVRTQPGPVRRDPAVPQSGLRPASRRADAGPDDGAPPSG